MLQLFDNKYPYTDFHELNLDWIISRLIQLDHKLTNFVSLNTIKYADPIEWDISKQYGTNTVVVDPATGIAYLSTQPVPSGVSIGDTDYWTEIFNLQQIIGNITDNLTLHDNGQSPTLLFPVTAGDWILWNNKLYVTTSDMIAGTALIVGSNIDEANVEDLTKYYTDTVRADLVAIIGALADLQTSDTSSIVNAINSVLSDTAATIGDLNDLTSSDRTSVVNAINSVIDDLSGMIGDLNDLQTTDKTSIVNAINEVNYKIDNSWSAEIYINVTDIDPSLGLVNLVNDGVTDNSAALNSLLSYVSNLAWNRCALFFPAGVYYFNSPVNVPQYIIFIGEGALTTSFRTNNTNSNLFVLGGYNEMRDFNVTCMDASSINAAFEVNGMQCIFERMRIYNFKYAYICNDASGMKTDLVYIQSNVSGAVGFVLNGKCVSSKFNRTTIYASGITNMNGFVYSGDYCMDFVFHECETAFLQYALVLDANTTIYPGDILISSCIFDGMYNSVVRFLNGNNAGNLIITNNWINYRPVTASVTIFNIVSSNNVSIIGNRIASLNSGNSSFIRGITLTGSKHINILNNDFYSLQYIVNANQVSFVNISNNNISNPSGTFGTAMFNIANCDHSSIQGNVSDGAYMYPALIASTTKSIISDNIFNTTSQITYSEATCIIQDNLYY